MTIKPPTQVFEFSAKVPDGDRIDAQFADHAEAINSLTQAIHDIRRSDGALKNYSVTADTLHPDLVDEVLQELRDAFRNDLQALHAAMQAAKTSATLAVNARDQAVQAASQATAGATIVEAGAHSALQAAQHAQDAIETAEQRALEALPTITNAENDIARAAAVAEDWAIVSHDWAEHMGGPGDETIPPNTLAIMGITGDHWSSKWWANKANGYAQDAEAAKDAAEAAAGSAIDAEESWDEFNDIYLGDFPVAPIEDNDGDPLQVGALYFDTTTNQMLVWNGTAWQGFAPATQASAVIFTPAGSISSTNVQAALEEVAADYALADTVVLNNANAYTNSQVAAANANANNRVLKAGDTMTGALNLPVASPPAPANAARWDYIDAAKVSKTASTGAALIPTGTTAQQPASPAAGMFRFNSQISKFEGHNGTTWGSIGGGATIADAPPPNPGSGELWWESDTGGLFIRYNDGDSQQWVQTNAASTLGEAPTDGLLYGRASNAWTSGGRFSGTLTVGSPAPSAMLPGHIAATQLTTSSAVGFNAYIRADGTMWKTWAAGYPMIQNFNSSTGSMNWYSGATQAAGADIATLPVIATLAKDGTFTATTNLVATSHVYANAGGFVGTNTAVVLATAASGGGVYLRPNGAGSATGQVTVDGSGSLAVPGTVTANTVSATSSLTSGNTITGTSVNALQYNITGATGAAINGDSTAVNYFTNANCYMQYVRASGLWQWVVNSTVNLSLDLSGNLTSRGNLTAGSSFITSGSANLFIGTNGAGGIYLRPVGPTNTAGQAVLNSAGNFSTGSINTSGAIISGAGVYAQSDTNFGIFDNGTQWLMHFTPGFYLGCTKATGDFNLASVNGNRSTWRNSDGAFIVPAAAWKPGGGAWADTSDARIKNVKGPYERGLDEILRLNPVDYVFKGNDTPVEPAHYQHPVPAGQDPPEPRTDPVAVPYENSAHYQVAKEARSFTGLIAQEVEQVFPEMVSHSEAFIDGEQVTDLRNLDTNPLIYALVNAVKTLSAKNDALEARLAALEGA